jgi:hypothetical protein
MGCRVMELGFIFGFIFFLFSHGRDWMFALCYDLDFSFFPVRFFLHFSPPVHDDGDDNDNNDDGRWQQRSRTAFHLHR